MKTIILRAIIAAVFLFLSTSIWAQYKCAKGVFGNGGEIMQGSNYTISSTLGQSFIGIEKSSLRQIKNGFWYQAKTINTEVEQITDDLPKIYNLFQNYPNPFNPSTIIKYSIPNVETRHASSVQLKVYNVLGQEVITLVNEQQKPGHYEVIFDATNLPSGTYFYRITAGNFIATKKLLLLK